MKTVAWPIMLRVVVLSLALGAASGIVAASLTTIYLTDYAAALGTIATPFAISTTRQTPAAVSTAFADVRDQVFSASVQLYFAKSDSPDPLKADRQGIVLTSDGWLAVANAGKGISTAVIGRSSYPITQSMVDPVTGVTFLKIDARDLPTIGFGEALALAAGDEGYLTDARDAFRHVRVVSVTRPAQASSDHPARLIALDAPTTSAYAPCFSPAGDLLGFVAADGSLLPVDDFLPAFRSLLKNGKVARPALGITFVDLSSSVVPAAQAASVPDSGERILNVTKGSAAATAGLEANDVLLSMDGQALDPDHPLDEQLLSYDLGQAPSFSVLRGSTRLTILVPLH